jgi:transposase-like protein
MMLHELRQAMVNMAREPLRGELEVEEAWIGGTQAGLRGSRQLRGRKAALIVVAVEERGRARMTAIPDFRGGTLIAFLRQNVAPGSLVYTDALNSFTGLEEAGFRHVSRSQPSRADLHRGAKSAVPLADRAIGNLKQWLLGTHHGVGCNQLQAYLDEFVFRHNRRKQPMAAFQVLLGLGTGHKSTTCEEIRSRGSFPIRQATTDPNILGYAGTTG